MAPEPWTYPVIPEGAATTLIPFPLTTGAPKVTPPAVMKAEMMAMSAVALLIFCLPRLLLNTKFCFRGFKTCLARSLSQYFCFAVLLNISIFSFIMLHLKGMRVNDLFFGFVDGVESLLDKLEKILTEIGILFGVYMTYVLRRRFVKLLGVEKQMMRADLRDVLTCFSMARYNVVELYLWKVEGLIAGFGSRSLFVHVVLGYNEPQNTRPHSSVSTSFICRERMQLNYDPADDAQRLCIIVKAQEVVSGAVGAMAPAAGAIGGALANLMTPLGPGGGAVAGAVAGVGAANSLGKEVGRVELSSSMMNRLQAANTGSPVGQGTQLWSDANFTKVDLVPQGQLWLRIQPIDTEAV